MEEKEREQPIMEPTTALNGADENSVASEIGSQKTDLGKFKNVNDLLDAYNNLQSEFTRKCQLLKSFEKDKTAKEKVNSENLVSDNISLNDSNQFESDKNDFDEKTSENIKLNEKDKKIQKNNEINVVFSKNEEIMKNFSQIQNAIKDDKNDLVGQNFERENEEINNFTANETETENQQDEEILNQNEEQEKDEEIFLMQFLKENDEAKNFIEEIKSSVNYIKSQQNPYQIAWAKVVLKDLKNKKDNPIINEYVLSNENIKNQIIKSYLKELEKNKAPIVMQGGQRLSGVLPDNPKTLAEAKELTSKMFS